MPFRVVFVGSSVWGLQSLETLWSLPEIEVVGAVTNPEVFQISYRPSGVRNVNHADVAGACEARGTPVYLMGAAEKMTSPALREALVAWSPQLVFVMGWYHMVPKTLRDLAPTLGVHFSLLPDYAGGAPLVWALINGETETGATLFQFERGVDTGPIYDQVSVPIEPRDTIATLYPRVGEASLSMLRRALPEIAAGRLVGRPQPEAGRRQFPQRGPEDGEIDWTWDAQRVDAFVRAQTRPYPGAFTRWGGAPVHIWVARPGDAEASQPPGTFESGGETLVVHCGRGTLVVSEAGATPGGLPVRGRFPG